MREKNCRKRWTAYGISSLYFLYLFLPLTLLVYFLVPGLRLKNIVLLAASLLFYAMGQPVYVLLLVGLSYANFAMARCIRPGKRNTLLLPVVVNLAVLGLFKYLTSSSASSASPSRTAA